MLRIKRLETVALAVAGLAICTDAAQGQSLKDRVIVHGFLSQGFADATDMPIFGIPIGGTADLRAAALQLRLAATKRDNLVVQFSHRRLGGSLEYRILNKGYESAKIRLNAGRGEWLFVPPSPSCHDDWRSVISDCRFRRTDGTTHM